MKIVTIKYLDQEFTFTLCGHPWRHGLEVSGTTIDCPAETVEEFIQKIGPSLITNRVLDKVVRHVQEYTLMGQKGYIAHIFDIDDEYVSFQLGTPAVYVKDGEVYKGEVTFNRDQYEIDDVIYEQGTIIGLTLYPDACYCGPDRIFIVPDTWGNVKTYHDWDNSRHTDDG